MVKFRKSLALLLSLTLVVSFALSGIVLPVSADTTTEPVDLYNGLGSFDDGTCKVLTYDYGTVVDDPLGTEGNKVLQIPTAPTDVTDAGTGEVTGQTYTYADYLAMGQFYDAETGTYSKKADHLKSYTISFDVYGGAMEIYVGGTLHATSNTIVPGQTSGWYNLPATTEWTTHTVTLYSNGDTEKSDWYNWYFSFAKGNSNAAHTDDTISYTYLDNITVVETQASSIELDTTSAEMKPGEELTLTATAAPLYAAHEDIVWSSDAEAVATVVDGVVTAKANGTANITATAGSLSATCVVEVSDNILPNGDLEDGNTGTASDLPVVELADGNHVAKWAAGTAYNTAAEYMNKMNTLDWQVGTYLVSFDVKGDTMYAGCYKKGTNVTWGTCTTKPCDEWTTYALTVVVGEGATFDANYGLHFKPYHTGGLTVDTYIDNIRIVKMPDTTYYTVAYEDFSTVPHNGVIMAGISTEVVANGGATVILDPDDSTNKVLMVPVDDAATTVRFKFPYFGAAYYDLTGLFKFTVRYKGTYTVETAGNATYLKTVNSAADEDGWKTYTQYVDLTSNSSNDINWAFGFKTSTTEAIYFDSICLEQIGYVTDIALDKTEAEVAGLGETLQLNVVENPTGFYLADDIVWTTTDDSVATVSNGLVTVKGYGEATITATAGELTASCKVTVNWPTEFFVGKYDGTMEPGEFVDFTWNNNSASPLSYTTLDGNRVLKVDPSIRFAASQTEYFQNLSDLNAFLKPNSLYRYSVLIKSDYASSYVSLAYDNRATDIAFYSPSSQTVAANGEWKRIYAWIKTGDAPKWDSTTWNLRFAWGGSDMTTPIYLDDFRLTLIDDYENRFGINEDMTYADAYLDGYGANGVIVTEADGNKALRLSNLSKSSRNMFETIPFLAPNAVYEISFDSKVDQDWIDAGAVLRLYWADNNAGVRKQYGGLAFKMTTEWQKNTFYIYTNSATTLENNTFYFDDRDAEGAGYFYLDNFSVKRVDNGNSVHGVVSGGYQTTVSIDGGKTWHQHIVDVPADTVISVKAEEHGGAYKVLTSLTVATNGGTAANILNKDVVNGYTAENFGTGDGREYQYVKGEGADQISAVLSDATSTSFKLDTVGTSLRYTEDDNYDGIRFLTRLQLKKGSFDAEAGTITVLYNGTEYTVTEMGSVMARSGAYGEELTLGTAKWQSVAYSAESGDMKLIDYTTSYVDFTVVMTKGANVAQEAFEAREYAACGYIVLEDAEGNQVTIYSENTQIDSVDSVQARM